MKPVEFLLMSRMIFSCCASRMEEIEELRNVNSGSVEKDTHVYDLCALETLARNAYDEAAKQQRFAQKNSKRASMFYTSQEEIALNAFCRDQVKPLLNELLDHFDGFQNLFQRDIKEMKDAFEQNDVYLDEIERQMNLLKDLTFGSITSNMILNMCDWKNKQTYNTFANVVSNKDNVIDVAAANASKAKTLLCVSYLDIYSVASKSKIDEASASKVRDKVVHIVLWVVDSGCSKHMTGDRALLGNFVEKFMGTVCFGNDNFAATTGYGDYIHGNITICHVYYIEGLGHNLFSVGQFCDGDLEVAFRSNTCHVQNLEGNDLLNRRTQYSFLYPSHFRHGCFFSHLSYVNATSTKSCSYMEKIIFVCLLQEEKSKKASISTKIDSSEYSKLGITSYDLSRSNESSFSVIGHERRNSRDHQEIHCSSINGKKYILVIVDDYSRYTWVYFLHSKDETPEIIKKFIAQAQLNYKAKVCKIRTDNGTEFKNATLKAHYEKLGIMQQFSTARTPQQNGVVERRNRTLVEAARTMLIFSRLPEFLWAEAVATACFTQNRSIIHTRHNKTPYELLRGRKPNVEYFHVFGSLCYPTNDRDDLGKMKPKADIGVFIGYSETSRGFRIYNRRTKKIMETIHVKFDELTAMASEHDCLEPELQRFINHNSSAETMNTPSKEDLDNLFGPMYEEYFEKKFFDTPINSAAQPTQIHEDSPSTSSIIVDEHEAPPIVTTSDEQTSPISLTEADEFNQEDSADFDGNSQFVPYNPLSHEEIESSTMALEPSNVQNFHQV
ncbi:retrovirus-related pol polyprotein from transposon TNT 1-94 [Tanacetum coccineum]